MDQANLLVEGDRPRSLTEPAQGQEHVQELDVGQLLGVPWQEHVKSVDSLAGQTAKAQEAIFLLSLSLSLSLLLPEARRWDPRWRRRSQPE